MKVFVHEKYYGLYPVLSCIEFFDVGLRYIYETLHTLFPNIICYQYQRYEPTLLRMTIFVSDSVLLTLRQQINFLKISLILKQEKYLRQSESSRFPLVNCNELIFTLFLTCYQALSFIEKQWCY